MHFYAWKKGLKTGMYYLRTRPKADAIAFTVDQAMAAKSRGENALKPVNTEPEECLSCGASAAASFRSSTPGTPSPRLAYRTRCPSFAATRPDGVTHTGKNRRVPPFPPILT